MKSAIRLVTISKGAEYELDLAAFPEAEPLFADVDDYHGTVLPLKGLVIVGTVVIEDQPSYMWLSGTRNAVLLKASKEVREGSTATFRSLTVGEFCLEIYHVRPDGGVELLRQDDWVFK